MKLTAKNIHTLAPPQGKDEVIIFDDGLPGFGLRLRKGGSRTFVFQYKRGGHRRITLGPVSAGDFGKIRKTAEKLFARVKLGEDPASDIAEAKAQAAETFETAVRRFLAWQKTRPRKNGSVGLKPRSLVEIERHLIVHARGLHKLQLAKIERRSIATCLAAVTENSGATTSNRVRSSLGNLFSWCLTEGLVSLNPVVGTRRHDEQQRERVLENHEIATIWTALSDSDPHFVAILKLLFLTASRKSEIGNLCWSEVHDHALKLAGSRVKNGREHTVWLSEPARAIIAAQPRRPDRDLIFGYSAGGFSGWSRCKHELDKRIAEIAKQPVAAWTLHDIRRSVSTKLADDLNIEPHVIECLLNHTSGFRAGVGGVYNKSHYERQVRAALDRWGEWLTAIVEGRATNVVSLRQALTGLC
jgi:integrase